MNTAAVINPSLSEEDEDDDDRGFRAAMPNRCFINFNKDQDEDGDEKRLIVSETVGKSLHNFYFDWILAAFFLSRGLRSQ